MEFIVKKIEDISDDALLADVESTIAKLNLSTITMKEYDTNGNYSSSTIRRRFGSWNNALSHINRTPTQEFHSTNDLLNNIRNAWLMKGSQPTRRDMDNHMLSRISSGAYLRKFGNWSNALDAFVAYMSNNDMDTTLLPYSLDNKVKHQTKRDPSRYLKLQVVARDGNCCRLCGVKLSLDQMQFDHIIPWSKGGETVLDNLRVLCRDCNLAIGNKGLL